MASLAQIITELPAGGAVLLKATLLLLAGWGLHFALARCNPRWRVLTWRLVMVGLILIAPAEWFVPKLRLTVEAPPSPTPISTVSPAVQIPAAPQPAAVVLLETPAANSQPAASWSPLQLILMHPLEVAAALWLIAVVVIAARSVYVMMHLRRLVRSASPAPDSIKNIGDSLAGALGCRAPDLRLTDSLLSPFVSGIVKPVVVVPALLTEGNRANDLPAILAHEFAHVRSRDLFWMSLARCISALLWFHPLAWWMRRAHAAACEEVCDGVAAEHAGGAPAYSRALASTFLELVVDAPQPVGVPMIRPSEIMQRIQNLRRGIGTYRLKRSWTVSLVVAASVMLATISSLKFVYAEAAPTDANKTSKATVTGTVMMNPGQKPFPGCVVSIRSAGTKLKNFGSITTRTDNSGRIIHVEPLTKTDEISYTATDEKGAFKIEIAFAGEADDALLEIEAPSESDVKLPSGLNLPAPTGLRREVIKHVAVRKGGQIDLGAIVIQPFIVAGMIKDEQGNPLGGVTVYSNSREIKSGKDGQFEIRNLPNREMAKAENVKGSLVFTSPETVRFTLDDLYAKSDEEVANLQITLSRGKSMKGVLLDPDGKPAAGLIVEAINGNNRRAARSDAAGRFELRALPDSELTLRAQDIARWWSARLSLKPDVQWENVQIQLQPISVPKPAGVDFLGMKIANVTPALKSALDLHHDFGVLVLDPGTSGNREDIGNIQAGYYFWMAGDKKVRNLREMIEEMIRIQAEPEDAGVIYKAHKGKIRLVYSFGHVNAESGGTNTQYLSLTDTEEVKLRKSLQSLTGAAPSGSRDLHFPTSHTSGQVMLRDRGAAGSWQENWKLLNNAYGDVTIPADKDVALFMSEDQGGDLAFLDQFGPDDLKLLALESRLVADSDLKHIRHLTGLKALSLQGATIDGSGFQYLKDLKNLEELRLGNHGTTIKDESMAQIATLPSLRWLALWGTGITDAGVERLRPMKQLQSLMLGNNKITDKSLEVIKGFGQLESLQLEDTLITDAGLANLSSLTSLKHIKLGRNNITDEGMERLKGLTNLENIWIDGDPITDRGLACLAGMRNLKELYADGTHITDAGLAALKPMKSFEHLLIGGTGDAGLAQLSELPSLNMLQIQSSRVTRAGIPSLKQMRSLKKLLISGDNVDSKFIADLKAALPACDVRDPNKRPNELQKDTSWEPRFESVYRLDDGQNLKRIGRPFIPERLEYYKFKMPGQAEAIPAGPDMMTFWWDGSLQNRGASFGSGLNLRHTISYATGMNETEYSGPKEILDIHDVSDWIVRKGASTEQLIKEFEAIVAKDLGKNIRFEKQTVERDVIVVRGKYKLRLDPGAEKQGGVFVYVDQLTINDGSGGGGGGFDSFLKTLESHVNTRVIDESDTVKTVDVNYSFCRDSGGVSNDPAKLDKLLKNLSRQTSLEFTKERRAVDVWFISEVKTPPARTASNDPDDRAASRAERINRSRAAIREAIRQREAQRGR